jgi:hypothetical protein
MLGGGCDGVCGCCVGRVKGRVYKERGLVAKMWSHYDYTKLMLQNVTMGAYVELLNFSFADSWSDFYVDALGWIRVLQVAAAITSCIMNAEACCPAITPSRLCHFCVSFTQCFCV